MVTAIGMIKNSADIIESYIRCNSNVVDNFVLLDNMSSDRTVEILHCLMKEGYQIEVLADKEIAHNQADKLMNLLYYCQKKYDSDFYIPLDDDEVIFAPDVNFSGTHIRNYLKANAGTRDLFHFNWRNYFPAAEDDPGEVCVPKRQTLYFDESMQYGMKCIVSRGLLADDSFILWQGSHSGDGELITERRMFNELIVAHYPCRSLEQVISKVVVGWLANLAIKDKPDHWAKHWQKMYDMVRQGIRDERLMNLLAIQYLGTDVTEADMKITKGRIPLDEKYFEMKYTEPKEFDSLHNIIMLAEKMALELAAKTEE